jgi:uncharacterized protein YndB with AHSA1/START domain
VSTITVSSHVAAPVNRVFAVFTDLEHAPGRVKNIKAIELLTPGSFRLGTRWRETRELLGRLDSAEMQVTAYELNRAYTITHHKAGARIETAFRFTPADDGTDVSVEFQMTGQGLPPGMLAPVGWAIDGKVRDVLAEDLSDLRTAAEAA